MKHFKLSFYFFCDDEWFSIISKFDNSEIEHPSSEIKSVKSQKSLKSVISSSVMPGILTRWPDRPGLIYS
jgi:hypothetical protein